MLSRNPSRSRKSSKEMQYLQESIKKIDSSDTANVESPFEATNKVNADKEIKKSTKRPKTFGEVVKKHLKKNLAAYVCLIIGYIVFQMIIYPLIGLNREMGEVKTKVESVKSTIESEVYISKQNNREFSTQISNLYNTVTSIKTYLINKFKANF